MGVNTGQASFNLSSLLATENQILQLQTALADPDGGVVTGSFRFQWQRSFDAENWFDIIGASSLSFAPTDSDVGAQLRVRIQYTDAQQNAETVFSPETSAVNNVNDLPVSTLAFKGSFIQGATIQLTGSVTDGDMLGGSVLPAELSWQWFAGGVPIDGANASNLVLGQSEVGKLISLEVSYVDRFLTPETLRLNSAQAVANVNDPVAGGITVEYDWQQGFTERNTLYASAALFDPDGPGDVPPSRLSWQWFSGGIAIPGAAQPSLVLTQAMAGESLRVEARYTDDLKSIETVSYSFKDSAGKDLLVENFDDQPVGELVLSGVPQQGQQLTVAGSITDADGIPTTGIGAPAWSWWQTNWWGDFDPIQGANGSQLSLTQAMVGASIVARYRYVDSFGNESEVSSEPIGPIRDQQDLPIGMVTISGDRVEGATLTASADLSDPDGIASEISWQWFANGIPIGDAVSDQLELTQSQVGKHISVLASYTDGLGTAESLSSALSTAPVANVDDTPEGMVWIDEAAVEQGVRLWARNDLTDEDGIAVSGAGSLAYQWFQDGLVIPGATGPSLLLDQTHVGHEIQVAASYVDAYGNPERVFSAPTAPVQNLNDAPVQSLRIQGVLRERETLVVAGTLSDPDLLGPVPTADIVWQWFLGE